MNSSKIEIPTLSKVLEKAYVNNAHDNTHFHLVAIGKNEGIVTKMPSRINSKGIRRATIGHIKFGAVRHDASRVVFEG